MNIPALKRYITRTYIMFSNSELSKYWNLGYINALKNNKLITDEEADILFDYNSKQRRTD